MVKKMHLAAASVITGALLFGCFSGISNIEKSVLTSQSFSSGYAQSEMMAPPPPLYPSDFSDTYSSDYFFGKFDKNGDNVIDSDERAAAKEVSFSSDYNFVTLNDLRLFHQLEKVEISNCPNVGSVDVSNCTQLKVFKLTGCTDSSLTSIDLSANSALEEINVSGCTSVKTLTLPSTATSLKKLICDSVPVTSLNISKCTSLEYLSACGCNLNSINLYASVSLKELYISDNPNLYLETVYNIDCADKLEFLSVSGANGTIFDLSANNALQFIDLSYCSSLKYLYLPSTISSTNSTLETLYVSETAIASLDVSKYVGLKSLYCMDCVNLTSLVLKNDSSVCSSLELLWCNGSSIEGPLDLNSLNALKYVRCYGAINLTSIDGNNLPNLSFINAEGCDSLKSIWISSCYELATLRVGGCFKLENISVHDCVLTALDVQYCPALRFLNCSSNGITSLDLSNNPNLETLLCQDNLLQTIVFSGTYTNLMTINCCYNSLTSLDLSTCPALCSLACEDNQIASLDITNNTYLLSLYCWHNKLSSVDFSHNINLSYLSISDCGLTSLDLSKNTLLESVDISNNPALGTVDFSANTKLKEIMCEDCGLKELNLSANTELTYLASANNMLTKLDLSANKKLYFVRCSANQITELNLSNLPDLEVLLCESNKLTELHIETNSKLRIMGCESNPMPTLDIHMNPDLCYTVKNYPPQLLGSYYSCGYTDDYMTDHIVSFDANTVLVTAIYDVTFDANGGSGTMPGMVADDGHGFCLPACTFTAPEGMEFDSWDLGAPGTVVKLTGNTVVHAKWKALPAKDPTFEDFIDRLYLYALLREPEADGKAFWMNKVLNEGFTGGRCAYGFLVEAQEFLNRDLTNEQFIDTLYQIFFDRAPDEGGKAFWLQKFAEGMTRAEMVNGFIDSTEWCNLCATYGVKSGAPNAKAEKPSKNAEKFAYRLYKECLGREPDGDGLQFWALRLTNLESSGYEAALGFFTSEEFKQKNIGDDEFIHRLYRTFMGRDEDADGFAFWKSHLGVDMTREDLVKGFAQSQEFTNICNEYGIDKGL